MSISKAKNDLYVPQLKQPATDVAEFDSALVQPQNQQPDNLHLSSYQVSNARMKWESKTTFFSKSIFGISLENIPAIMKFVVANQGPRVFGQPTSILPPMVK